jgi:hypothetical protein
MGDSKRRKRKNGTTINKLIISFLWWCSAAQISKKLLVRFKIDRFVVILDQCDCWSRDSPEST